MLAFANFQQRVPVKLDHGEVIEKGDVVRLTFLALKLLASQRAAMFPGELINGVTNYNA